MVKEEINKIDSWSIDSVTDGLQTLKKMHPSDMVLRSFLSNNYFSINKRFFMAIEFLISAVCMQII